MTINKIAAGFIKKPTANLHPQTTPKGAIMQKTQRFYLTLPYITIAQNETAINHRGFNAMCKNILH